MYRVLVIDDEPLIREGLKHIIEWEEYGAEISGEASNGQEALEIYSKVSPHIIITDVMMPLMNGIELISRIREKDSSLKIIIISGFDDFKYVKEALRFGVENYIMKPINGDELSQTVLSAIEKIETELYRKIKTREDEKVITENILYRLATNQISPKEIMEKAYLLDIDVEAKGFQVCILKILNEHKSVIDDINLLRFALKNICEEIIGIWGKAAIFCDLEGNVVIIFYHTTEDRERYVEKERCIESIVANMKKLTKVDLFAALGDIQKNIELVYQSYIVAKSILDYAYICPPNNVKTFETLEAERLSRKEVCDIDWVKLQDLLKSLREEELAVVFEEIYKKIGSEDGISLDNIYGITVEMLALVLQLIRFEGLDPQDVFGDPGSLYRDTFKRNNVLDMLDNLKKITFTYVRHMVEHKQKPKSLIQTVIEYVDENYDKDLSLKTLSQRFNITTAYLGQLFKKETGELFTNYVNCIRVNAAKEFLHGTGMKASEVAQKVGYSDPDYFYKVFKKVTGFYPSEFKQGISQ